MITSSLSGEAESDDEIAAVLARESAHVLANHKREVRGISVLANVILAPIILVFLVAEKVGLVEENSNVDPMWLAFRVCMYVRRRQEAEAGYIGTLLMVNAGFDPSAMLSIIGKLKKFEDQTLSDNPTMQQVPQWMNTHPKVS